MPHQSKNIVSKGTCFAGAPGSAVSDGTMLGRHREVAITARSKTLPRSSMLHPLCTTFEFAQLIRRDEETVKRKIRRREVTAIGRPALINVSEALRYGLTIEDARNLLIAIRAPSDVQDAV